MDFTRSTNSRAGMSEAEKKSNKARDEELLQNNLNTMKGVPSGPRGEFIRSFGEAANKKLQQDIQNASPAANSKAQYQHEREAGDPNAQRLSFEEWKKL
jgi:hypothetical protein